MQFLVFIIAYPFLWLISILPFRVLYLFSDFIYLLIYHVIGYRKKTVRENLLIAFPEKSALERTAIEKKFYHHLCDLFLEMIKTLTISKEEMDEHFVLPNLDVLKEMERDGKSIALLTSHYASYEWSVSINNKLSVKGYAIYKKIANVYFDKLVRDIRQKFGANLINTKETIPTIESNYLRGIQSIYGFASDQSPKASRAINWGTFFGIETPLQTGAEMLAKKFDMNVMYMRIQKVKRGYYECRFEVLSYNPKSVPDFELTHSFIQKVEEQIKEAPEYYLWTHKRWKHRR
ncbi:lysophospholipid acyltransferase family protein [Flavobacterium sp.]|uniref:lysophospholipid acyltransferase family protein n=1 Tax=Flavobacterium sp. TaxID=239 RepID=UPI00262EFBCA|nr:lysophospholipid acyltransferase family protein [Flavobacterium sp.]MDD2985576.1 lysophospholipid acyltransferase family protein [Flavobacterium sp.]